MIGALRGKLILCRPPDLLVETGGICLELQAPLRISEVLPEPGAEVSLYTHLISRDDGMSLYAFASERERNLFRLLIKVSGVGPRIALAALSGMSADILAECLLNRDLSRLMGLPGIGRRTAERMCFEIGDKLVGEDLLPTEGEATGVAKETQEMARRDALSALQKLGYSQREAEKAVRRAAQQEGSADDAADSAALIRGALRLLVGSGSAV